jgi:hypothetical protein
MPEIAVQHVIELRLEGHDAAGDTQQDDECCRDEREPQVEGSDETAHTWRKDEPSTRALPAKTVQSCEQLDKSDAFDVRNFFQRIGFWAEL